MVSVVASSAVDCGFKPWSGQTKDYKIGICCFSAKLPALRRKSKDWLAWNQDNVSEWGNMSICRLLFQLGSTKKSNYVCWSSTKQTSSSFHWKLTCFRHEITEKLQSWRYTTITHSLIVKLFDHYLCSCLYWDNQSSENRFLFINFKISDKCKLPSDT